MSDYSVDSTIYELEEAVKLSLQDMGKQIEQDAKAAAPVSTGRLRNSISFNVNGTEVTVGSDVPYAPYQEAKRHFLQEAVDKNSTYLANILADKMK